MHKDIKVIIDLWKQYLRNYNYSNFGCFIVFRLFTGNNIYCYNKICLGKCVKKLSCLSVCIFVYFLFYLYAYTTSI